MPSAYCPLPPARQPPPPATSYLLPTTCPLVTQLSSRRTRSLVIGLITLAVLIAVLATVLILRGWENRELQAELREVRRERGLRY